jgi:predicted O-linked N-acetylglucosamine transferase (SPINDLY family)/predicted SAM-dependent methyltransferase
MKVSILMITYNHEKFIAQAIDSILTQNVDFDYEIVIGEDCSTDQTRQIVIGYQKKYPDKIRLLLPESNLGMLPNFVNTYRSCKGEYIAVLEGDDYWISKDKLKKQVNFLDNHLDCSICFTNALLFWEDKHQDPRFFAHEQAKISVIEDLLIKNFISTPTVMYRNGLIQDFPDWYLAQSLGDWSFYIMLAEHGNIGYIDEVMSAYRIHKGGVWSCKNTDYQIREAMKMLQNVRAYFATKENQKYQEILDNVINYYSETLSKITHNQLISTDIKDSRLVEKSKPYKLHIGCGQNIFKDWINIDIEANHPNVDLLCDVREGLPFENASCSLIYNEHVLEHLTVEEGLFFLKECQRVLQPGGTLRVAMPNLEYIVEHYKSENWRNQNWLKWPEFQFVQTRAEMINICFRWWEHKWLYDLEELTRRLSEVGYSKIRNVTWGESTIPEFKNRETREDSLLIIEAEVTPITNQEPHSLVSICIPTSNSEQFVTANTQLSQSRKQLAESWLSLPDDQLSICYQGALGRTHQSLLNNRTHNSLNEQDQHFFDNLLNNLEQGFQKTQSIQNLLAAMLYYRADQLPLKCDLSQIPDWLIADYLKFLFSATVNFQQVGEADHYYKYLAAWLDYLHVSIFSNLEDPSWQKIVNIFARIANFIPIYFNDFNLKKLYIQRAEIIEFFLKINKYETDYKFKLQPSSKKKIRLGILANHYSPSAETFAALPAYEYLSRDFEVILYSFKTTNHPLEEYCRSCANHSKLLPIDLREQVDIIRADDLDILFFATNVTAVTNQISLLASHRLARIQLTSGGSVVTTGMGKMDYFISGKFTDPSPTAQGEYREKLIQLTEAAHCFSYGNDTGKSTVVVDREGLGISSNMVVFTSGANFFKLVPELIHTWAKIVSQVPNAALMLLPYGPNWSNSYPKQAFENNLTQIFAQYGISADRLIVLDPQPVPNRQDIKEYYKLADVYLDSYPFSGTTSLVEPLQANIPIVSIQGNSFRSAMGAAMIKSLDIADLVADNEESYIQLATNLGSNIVLRQQKKVEIQTKMQENPSFLDSRNYSAKISDLFIELFEQYSRNAQNENLRLRDVNLMIFPDWNQSEELVGLELQQVIQALATQPNAHNTTLLIDITNIAIEDAQMFLSSVAMNLMMEEDIDITEELGISLIEDLNHIQWENLLPRINSRIVMDCDNQETVTTLLPKNLAQCQIESFVLS